MCYWPWPLPSPGDARPHGRGIFGAVTDMEPSTTGVLPLRDPGAVGAGVPCLGRGGR